MYCSLYGSAWLTQINSLIHSHAAVSRRYCAPWLLLATTVPQRLADGRTISVCTFSLPRDKYLAYYLTDLVLFYATPLLTSTVLYALIGRTLLSRARPAAYSRSRRSTADDGTLKVTNDGASCAGGSAVLTTTDTSSNVQVPLSKCAVAL